MPVTGTLLQRDLIPLSDVIVLLDCSRSTITRWEAEGRLRLVRIGRRVYLPRAELERLVAA